MDERSDAILNHIEAQRDELGRNLNELETRVRRSTDWRTHFEKNPMMMLGVALGGGLLLGAAVGRRREHYRSSESHDYHQNYDIMGAAPAGAGMASTFETESSSYTPVDHESHDVVGFSSAGVGSQEARRETGSSSRSSWLDSMQRSEVGQTLDNVKAALVAFGLAKAKEFMNQAIPGFEQHLRQAEERKHHDRDQQDTDDRGSRSSPPSWDRGRERWSGSHGPASEQSWRRDTGSDQPSSQQMSGQGESGGFRAESQEPRGPSMNY